VNDYQELIR